MCTIEAKLIAPNMVRLPENIAFAVTARTKYLMHGMQTDRFGFSWRDFIVCVRAHGREKNVAWNGICAEKNEKIDSDCVPHVKFPFNFQLNVAKHTGCEHVGLNLVCVHSL